MAAGKKRATALDVARVAGVSQSVVSRSFTPGGRVAVATRRRVHDIAQQLGYQPNILARNLVKQSTNIVGVVIADITNPFYPYVLKILTQKLKEMGHQVLLFSLTRPEEIDQAVEAALQYRVEALVVASVTLPSEAVERCTASGLPIILFNRYVRMSQVRAVSCDNIEGGRLVANVLLDAGHRRFAYVGGSPDTSTNEDRHKGFVDRLQERGYELSHSVGGEYSYDAGFAAAMELLGQGSAPDAIFCANDIIAIGALDAARHSLRLSVPGDVSIIGFDDIPAASWPSYALTTIRQPVDRMLDRTLALLTESLDPASSKNHSGIELIPGLFVPRTSARLVQLEVDG